MTIAPTQKALSQLEADAPHSLVVRFGADQPLKLDAGVDLRPFQIAYQTYGTLNAEKSNAILLCHALTGDQHVANVHPITGKPGWWEVMVGPGKPIDTDRYFVIASNVVGGCMGTTGPASTNPANGHPWGLDLPLVTIRDMVRAQAMLIDHLGIETLFAVIGGSMGGMQVLQWAASYPERVFAAMPIATAAKHSSQNIAFHEVGRQSVMADPDWRGGRYLDAGVSPTKGLAVARMAAHITYLSDEALQRKFGRKFQGRDAPTFSFDADFQIENYLRYQGTSFVDRFDANSYLYVTRACDYFDLAEDYGGSLAAAFKGAKTRFCVVSFNSDWLYPTSASRAIVHALNAAAASVSFVEIDTDRGHDAFLLNVPEFFATTRGFLDAAARSARHPAQFEQGRLSVAENGARTAVMLSQTARIDLLVVADMVAPKSRVLDVGCGDGTLLRLLAEERGVDARGIELSQSGVNDCVAKGLSVIQGDADADLADYPDDAFDYVVLSQTLQATRRPRQVLEHMLRIGHHAIVSFPNFGHWRIRAQIALQGRMPVTQSLSASWYETPNIHFCTIRDFIGLVDEIGAKTERSIALDQQGRPLRFSAPWWVLNLIGDQAVFELSRKK